MGQMKNSPGVLSDAHHPAELSSKHARVQEHDIESGIHSLWDKTFDQSEKKFEFSFHRIM
jgi:hypothetical protein